MNIFETMGEAYAQIAHRVVQEGEHVSPREQLTAEIRDYVFRIEDPTRGYASGTNRGLSPTIAAVEAIQLIGEFANPKLVVGASHNFTNYIEDDGTFWGSYGKRIEGQMRSVIRKLTDDSDTRQAVITLWDPRKDNLDDKKDYPCTIALTFTQRSYMLNLSVMMRSNDVWLGLPYDVFQFTQLQIAIARALGLVVGDYTHHAVSMHAYERDWDDILNLRVATTNESRVINSIGDNNSQTFNGWRRWEEIRDRARKLALENEPAVGDWTRDESWYRAQVLRAFKNARSNETIVG